MDLLKWLVSAAAILIGFCVVIRAWVVLMIDASVRYRILVSLVCVLMLLSLVFLSLVTMFNIKDALDSCK